jgi:phosphoribosylformylglycinamidine synthase
MSTNYPSDAGVVNLKGTGNAIAMTCDCNSRYVYSNPEIGAKIAVAEAARNIVCAGGEPLAITNCLNFGNPYHEGTYWQFVNTIKGMSEACRKFNTPVTGGNVSFYNQASINGKVEAVKPSPVIGMVGTLEKKLQMTLDFKQEGSTIYLLGKQVEDINCSEYLYSYKGVKLSPTPYFDIDEEYNLQQALSTLILEGLVESCHDVSDGGLFITLLESAMPRDLGFEITTNKDLRLDSFLFGESQGRAVLTIKQDKQADFLDLIKMTGISCKAIGTTTNGSIIIDNEDFGNLSNYKQDYDNSIAKSMGE